MAKDSTSFTFDKNDPNYEKQIDEFYANCNELTEEARERQAKATKLLRELSELYPIVMVSTGFGLKASLADNDVHFVNPNDRGVRALSVDSNWVSARKLEYDLSGSDIEKKLSTKAAVSACDSSIVGLLCELILAVAQSFNEVFGENAQDELMVISTIAQMAVSRKLREYQQAGISKEDAHRLIRDKFMPLFIDLVDPSSLVEALKKVAGAKKKEA